MTTKKISAEFRAKLRKAKWLESDHPIYKSGYHVIWSPIPGSRNGIPPKPGQKRKDK